MVSFDLPKFKFNYRKIKKYFQGISKKQNLWFLVLVIFLASGFGFLAGTVPSAYFYLRTKNYLEKLDLKLIPSQGSDKEYSPQTSQEQLIINSVKAVSPAVVSIVISKDVPIIEEYFYNPFGDLGPGFQIPQYRQNGTEKREIGGGTGVIISKDGMILTNKHVVLDKEADYTVLTNDGKEFPAKVLARDPVQDLAIIKIEPEKASINDSGQAIVKDFPTAKLGDSGNLQIGQSVIAIGNALGEFRNTVSVGVISGLGRTISASGGGLSETLEDVIQTDAAINAGNSGGPLLNLKGEVIGINTATSQGAQNIGFSIPINKAKRDIEQVKTSGKIVYPFLGIRYVLINEKVKKDNNLTVDSGAFIIRGDQEEAAITPGSAADKSGLKEKDIVLELNGEKITTDNSLAKIIQKYNPGDKVVLKILRKSEEKNIEVVLGEKTE